MKQDELFFGPIQKREEIEVGDRVNFRRPSNNVIPFNYLRFKEVPGYVTDVQNVDGTRECRVFFGTEIIKCAETMLTKNGE